MPLAACTSVYADTTLYRDSATRFAGVSIAADPVFGDNTAAQVAAMTPTFTGAVGTGYAMAATIGIVV